MNNYEKQFNKKLQEFKNNIINKENLKIMAKKPKEDIKKGETVC